MASSLLSHTSGVLLATAQVTILDSFGHPHVVRAVLDSGSCTSFMTSACAQRFRFPLQPTNLPISGLGNIALPPARQIVHATIIHGGDPPHLGIDFLVTSQISQPLPSQYVPHENWIHLQHLKLADTQFYLPLNIDLLLGADVYPMIRRPGQIRSQRQAPTALETTFGWALIGPYGPSPTLNHVHFHHSVIDNENQPIGSYIHQSTKKNLVTSPGEIIQHNHEITSPIALLLNSPEDTTDELTKAITKLWELDNVSNQPMLSSTEKQCEEIFVSTTHREASGRYCVSLPFFDSGLGESYKVALRQFNSLEGRLQRQSTLHDACLHAGLLRQRPYEIGHSRRNFVLHTILYSTSSSSSTRRP